jgi:hypothetical protein
MADPVASAPHMPAYGVGAPEWEALPWSWARDRLEATRNVWLVTVSGRGRPHSMPVWGVWADDEQRFAFSCAPGSRKARNLDQNPACVITTEDTIECLSLEGTAVQITDEARLGFWVGRYLAKYQPLAPDLSAEFLRSNLIFEVRPERAFAIIERVDEFATRASRWKF